MSNRTLSWTKDCLPGPVFQTTGRIVFDPDRGDMKRRTHEWVVLELDRGLTAYYRWFFRQHWYEIDRGGRRRPIYQPSWDAHISVVRGERAHWAPKKDQEEMWWFAHKRWHGQHVPVYYTNHIRQTGDVQHDPRENRPDNFWFVEAWSECVLGIRNMLMLPTSDSRTGRAYSNHITIGRTY